MEDAESTRRWLLSPRTRGLMLSAFMTQLGERLRDDGIPAWRMSCSVLTMHPEVFVVNCRWKLGVPTVLRRFDRGLLQTDRFLDSPAALVFDDRPSLLRVRLDGAEAERFPITRDLAEAGGTDYLGFPLEFSTGQWSFWSVATDEPAGFTDEHVERLRGLSEAVATVVELRSSYAAQSSLLTTYLGRNAAQRVLAGAFHRGGGEPIDAVIWSCDLRDFTARVDAQPVEEVLRDLDDYFSLVTEPIHHAGGEVLKLIGDAVLAVFPVDEVGRQQACHTAVAAAREAIATGDARNTALGHERAPLRFGIGLHLGQVMYGNVGASDRLDFTVIGAAVNEACRIEALCKELGERVVLSAAVAAELPADATTTLGQHRLRGVRDPVELFRLDD